MANWISHDGKLYAAKERVALKNNLKKTIINPSEKGSKFHGEEVAPGADFIYEGPDRAAMFTLFEEKTDHLGMDFRHDAEFINRVKQLGYASVEAYCDAMGYIKADAEEKFKETASVVVKHDLPARAKELAIMGGGNDTSGGGADIIGGFGEQRVRPAAELD